ncbi:hypothetical protein AnigIFM60653_002402 [Aspergillus niger]|nr:hypothetical protein AnigIFM60653_002402 [Aspergillus niger]
MKLDRLLHLLSHLGLAAAQYNFYPETANSYTNDLLPWLYNVSEAQRETALSTSYWTCSFLTASDNHQYMLLGHTMWIAEIPMARASLLDLTDTSYYRMFLYSLDTAAQPADINSQLIDASIGDVGIEALSGDNVSRMRSFSNHSTLMYDLTYNATSQVLYNGGLGELTFGNDSCGEWAIPAARTEGILTVRGERLFVDPERSFTWYDRQWGSGVGFKNYTWFQLHVPNTDIKASIWAIDYESSTARIATFRFADGSHQVLPFELSSSSQNMYYSAATNATYPTSWSLNFPGRGHIQVQSIRADQETYNTSSDAVAAYEGFSTFKFNMFGYHADGFGITEIVNST